MTNQNINNKPQVMNRISYMNTHSINRSKP